MDEVKGGPEKKPEPEKNKPAEKPKAEKPFEHRWELDINGKKIYETEKLQIDFTRDKGYHLVPRTRRI